MFKEKEKRDRPLTVRLPNSVVEKIKELAATYNVSQSEVIETLVNDFFKSKYEVKKDFDNDRNSALQ